MVIMKYIAVIASMVLCISVSVPGASLKIMILTIPTITRCTK